MSKESVSTTVEDIKNDNWEMNDVLMGLLREESKGHLYGDTLVSFNIEISNLTFKQQCFGLKLNKNTK